jgi:SAM-dependent methyltransferase
MMKKAKALLRRQLARAGYRLVRVRPEDEAELARLKAASYDASMPLPPGAEEYLRADHPRLLELRRAYEQCQVPMRAHSLWNPKRMQRQLEMKYFRGDNVYVWQLRNVREHARLKYFLYAQYVRAIDRRGLLEQLGEDGAFGCWTFEFEGFPKLSRDLLDSVNELYFLDRHLQLFSRTDFRVLDIGAGYGRLAHRMTQAVPGVAEYVCTDAVAESTFLCEYYLRHRGCEARTHIVPLDAVDTSLPQIHADLAVNIHSFSEMRFDAIAGWFERLGRLRIPHLMIVPNDPQSFLSREPDGSQRDFSGLIRDAGYHQIACEPVMGDANVRALVGIDDHMFLFERR